MKDEAFLIFDAQTQSVERVIGESELTTRVEEILADKDFGYELRIFKRIPVSRLISVFAAEQNLIRKGVKPTYENIGKVLEITKQRVEQIYKSYDSTPPFIKQKTIDEEKLKNHFGSFDTSKLTRQELIETVKFSTTKLLIDKVLNDFPKKDRRRISRSKFIAALISSGIDTTNLTAAEIAKKIGFSHCTTPATILCWHKISYKKKHRFIKSKGGI